MWPSAPARNEPIGARTMRLRSRRGPMRPGESRWRYPEALKRGVLSRDSLARGGSRRVPGARSRQDDLEHGDLAGDAQPQREAVEAGAAVHVEPARAAGGEA